MLELNIFKNNNRTSVSYGKYYAHVEYKKTRAQHTVLRGDYRGDPARLRELYP